MGLTAELTSYLRRSHTDAFVVLHDGELALDWYADGVKQGDSHILFSVTKSVVGLVASALIADGSLDDGMLVGHYVPETKAGGYASATVRQVLDMQASVRFVEDYDGPDVRRYREAVGQVPSRCNEGIHAFVRQLPRDGAHGEKFSYISPTTDVAGWVCENATGRSVADLISTYIWEPMGAERDADMLVDRLGAARASGGLCATVRDMARIGQLLIAQPTLLLNQAITDLKREGDGQAWEKGTLADFMPGAAYRSFWYQPDLGSGVFVAAGIYGQRIYVDVPRRVVIAQQASLPTAFHEETWLETLPLFTRISRGLSGIGRAEDLPPPTATS